MAEVRQLTDRYAAVWNETDQRLAERPSPSCRVRTACTVGRTSKRELMPRWITDWHAKTSVTAKQPLQSVQTRRHFARHYVQWEMISAGGEVAAASSFSFLMMRGRIVSGYQFIVR
jgi:hypothetical protein